MKVTVVGAANVDITARPLGKYIPGDSNPGRVEIGFGGVGRNIAHNLCLLGADVRFVTAFGDDPLSQSLQENCRHIGMKTDPLRVVKGSGSNRFVCVNDHNGEMVAGVADMSLADSITQEFLEYCRLDDCDAVVADCNIPEGSLIYLADRCSKLYIDATSGPKSLKIKSILGSDRPGVTLKCNRAEAEAISGLDAEPPILAEWFLDQGIGRVYITLGAHGACSSGGLMCPAEPVEIINTTGAGDAFISAIVYSELLGMSPEMAMGKGLQAAAIALQSPKAVNDEIINIR